MRSEASSPAPDSARAHACRIRQRAGRRLGLPRDPHAALATALGERTVAVDVGMLDDSPVLQHRGHRLRRPHRPPLQPASARTAAAVCPTSSSAFGKAAAMRARTTRSRSTARSHRAKRSSSPLLTARNTAWGCRSHRGQRLDDGLLEACVVEDRPVLARFRDARHLALGSVHRAPRMVMQPIRTAVVEADGEIEFHLDGEPGVARDRVTVTVRPGALMVKV